MKSYTGHPVTDKRLAMRIAREVSAALEAGANRRARRVVFGGEDHTLDELLDEYHQSARAQGWTPHHRKAQERFRDFWLSHLRGMYLTDVREHEVERLAAKLDVADETRRKYLVYLVGAFNYAVRKLKWIPQGLTALDMPKPKRESKAYSLEEVGRLLTALERVDTRAAWLGHVAWQSGRRLSAIRSLRKDHVTLHDDHAVLHFPRNTDKARNRGEVVVVGRAFELTRELLGTRGKYVMGTKPPDDNVTTKVWLPEAERLAGIEHVTGRAWHAIKRRYASEARGMKGYDRQSGTSELTLKTIYAQDDIGPKLELARALNRAANRANGGTTDGTSTS